MDWNVLRNSSVMIVAGIYGVLFSISFNAGLFGLWLLVLLVPSLWRYCYEVLRTFARGRSEVPPPSIESMNPIGSIIELLHFVAFPGLIIATAPYQPIGTVVAIFAALIFPASAAVMGLTASLEASLTPAPIIAFMRTLGRDYWLLVVGCAAVIVSAMFIERIVLPQLGYFSSLASLILAIWALLAVFALVGSSLREHRLEFTIIGEKKTDEEYELDEREREWRQALDRAYASIRSGLLESGYATLRQLIAKHDGDEVQFWLVENMLDWEDKSHALNVAGKLVTELVGKQDLANALDVYKRCRGHGKIALGDDVATPLKAYAESLGWDGIASELASTGVSPVRSGI